MRVLRVAHIIVCGHSDCGAMRAMLEGTLDALPNVGAWLRYAERAKQAVLARRPGGGGSGGRVD